MIHYTVHLASVDLLLVELRILVNAPLPMLIAGIGDTLAKWYEADVQISRFEDSPVALKIAHYTAKLCADVMFDNAEAAINDAEKGVLSLAFVKVAYGVLVQLLLEGKVDEVEKLTVFYKKPDYQHLYKKWECQLAG